MTLAPQLRQSLEMLQMPVMELRQAILKEMAVNPTVEMSDPAEIHQSPVEQPLPQQSAEKEMDFDPNVDDLLRQDDEYRDYFMQGLENAPSDDDDEKRQNDLCGASPVGAQLEVEPIPQGVHLGTPRNGSLGWATGRGESVY